MTLPLRRAGRFSTLVLTFAAAGSCAAQTSAPAPEPTAATVNPDPAKYLYEEDIHPGQKGYGLTCLHAGKIERFEITVIDVVKNLTPGNNAILVRCSGLGLEHSGIIAGMSGSPAYIDGKMIGAVAFGWPLGKDPIAGVQPIRQMLAIPVVNDKSDPAAGHASTRWRGNAGLAGQVKKLAGYRLLAKNLARLSPDPANTWNASPRAGLSPLVSPLMVSGGSDRTTSFLTAALAGTNLVPVASGSAGGTGAQLGGVAELKPGEIKLEPGSSLAIPMVTGDMDLSAIGTVTEVRDGRVYAFGHAMFAEGSSHLPISTGYIYTIMPNLQQSFKMGSSYQPQGALVTDEQTGIVGVLGEKAKTVPIKLHVKIAGALDHTYHYQLAPHPRLTPELLGAILSETLTAQRAMPKEFTAQITGEAKFAGATIPINLLGTTQDFQLAQAVVPVALVGDNPFKNLALEEISLDATITPANRAAVIKAVNVKNLIVAPGDTVSATVEVEPFQQPLRKLTIQLQVPADTPDGEYDLVVGSAEMALGQEEQFFPNRFDPQNVEALVAAIQNILGYQRDKLYARLVLDVAGAAQKGRELGNLPPSRVALYASEKLKDATPLHNAVLASVDAGGVLDGGEMLTITVDKNANKRFYSEPKDIFGGHQKLPMHGHRLDRAPSPPASGTAPDE